METGQADRPGSRAEAQRELLGSQEFRALLRSERERAERMREPFAVVAFHLAGDAWDERAVVDVLAARVRATDVVGRVERGDLGVLLRSATPMTAACLAEEVQRALAARGRLECTVFGYPPFEYGLRPGWGSAAQPVPPPGSAPEAAPAGTDLASAAARRITRSIR